MRRLLLAIVLSTAAAAAGCSDGVTVQGGGRGAAAAPGFDRNALLKSFADTIVLPTYQELTTRTASLLVDVTEYADAVRTAAGDKAQRLADARQAWRDAMDVAQQAELLQFGPAGTAGIAIGGSSLRDEMYAYPTTNPCRVDEELVENVFGQPGFIQRELVDVYGLAALEQLLFDHDTTNACAPGDSINAGGSWAALVSSGELEQRRADYAVVVATGIRDTAAALRDRWSPTGGDFAGALATAGQGVGSPYPSAQTALDDVFAGLFYVDFVTKDLKVAQPAGLAGPGGPQPGLVESPFAQRSKEHVIANLVALQRFLLGNRPGEPARLGFDEFLAAAGAPDLAVSLQNDIAEAVAAFQAIGGTLEAAVVNDPVAVRAAFDELKDVTDALKSRFVTVLNISLPQQGAGDND